MASIKKRGKTWYVRFSKRENQWDPEKQKNVSVLKQKSKGGFKTKAEAQQYGVKMEAASISGVDVSILHVCGGDPSLTILTIKSTLYSPRMWR